MSVLIVEFFFGMLCLNFSELEGVGCKLVDTYTKQSAPCRQGFSAAT